jgi:hypothetical protein
MVRVAVALLSLLFVQGQAPAQPREVNVAISMAVAFRAD